MRPPWPPYTPVTVQVRPILFSGIFLSPFISILYTYKNQSVFVLLLISLFSLLSLLTFSPLIMTNAQSSLAVARYDTDGDGRLTWNDAGGGPQFHQFFGRLREEVGERIVTAERSISGG